eukprot:scaffold473_cov257-Pinguiococcus_pyrenoidosus.AAC.3
MGLIQHLAPEFCRVLRRSSNLPVNCRTIFFSPLVKILSGHRRVLREDKTLVSPFFAHPDLRIAPLNFRRSCPLDERHGGNASKGGRSKRAGGRGQKWRLSGACARKAPHLAALGSHSSSLWVRIFPR